LENCEGPGFYKEMKSGEEVEAERLKQARRGNGFATGRPKKT